MKATKLAHRLQYLLFSGVIATTRALGIRGRNRLGTGLGRLGYSGVRIRRSLVESQLRHAFPDRDERWIRETARAAYEHLGRETLAMLSAAERGVDEVRARTDVEGLDDLEHALGLGRGVVIATGHFGNWEIGGAAVAARGVALDVVAQRQANPLFDRRIVESRQRLGMRVIERGRAPREALRALRNGRAVAFVADQNAGRHGVFVPFFGRSASTHRGPALLALRADAPMFIGTAERVGDRYMIRLVPIEVDRSGPLTAAEERLTAAFTAALEAQIRRAPEQYFWHHRRWKTRPPEEREH